MWYAFARTIHRAVLSVYFQVRLAMFSLVFAVCSLAFPLCRSLAFYHEFTVGSPLRSLCIRCGLTMPSVVRYTVRSFAYFTVRFPMPSHYIRRVSPCISREFFPIFRVRTPLRNPCVSP